MDIRGIVKFAARIAVAKALKQQPDKKALVAKLREKVKAAKEYHAENNNKRSAKRLQDAKDELAEAMKKPLAKKASEDDETVELEQD